jgi:hypothetical protein
MARGVTLVGFVGSGVWRYTANFSPDLALCGLLVGGLLAARSGRPLLAGLASGLAVSLKLYAVVVFVPVPVLAVVAAGRRVRAAGLVAAGGIAGLLPGAGFNAWQYGSPLGDRVRTATPRRRWARRRRRPRIEVRRPAARWAAGAVARPGPRAGPHGPVMVRLAGAGGAAVLGPRPGPRWPRVGRGGRGGDPAEPRPVQPVRRGRSTGPPTPTATCSRRCCSGSR